ncbi:type VII secretion system-associated protein [Micromonospora sp. NPDC003197]
MRWMYAVDPAYEGIENVPPYAIAGAYPVGADGTVAEEMIPNPDYRPSPRVLGLPDPANAIEAAIQNAATGHGDDAAVRAALLAGTVFVDPANPDDGLDVRAWTSDRYLPAADEGRDWRRLPMAQLAAGLGGRALLLNPGTDLEVRLPAAALA